MLGRISRRQPLFAFCFLQLSRFSKLAALHDSTSWSKLRFESFNHSTDTTKVRAIQDKPQEPPKRNNLRLNKNSNTERSASSQYKHNKLRYPKNNNKVSNESVSSTKPDRAIITKEDKTKLFSLLRYLIPSGTQTETLNFRKRHPLPKKRRTELNDLSIENITAEQINDSILNLTEYEYPAPLIKSLDKQIQILFKLATDTVDLDDKTTYRNCKLSTEALLGLTGYFIKLNQFSKVVFLEKVMMCNDRPHFIEYYHVSFSQLKIGEVGLENVLRRLTRMKHRVLKLDSYLIYELLTQLKRNPLTVELYDELIKVLQKKNIDVEKVFGLDWSIHNVQQLDYFLQKESNLSYYDENKYEIDELRIRFLLNENRLDEAMGVIKKENIRKLPQESIEDLIKTFIKQERFDELWYSIKEYFYWDWPRARLVIDELVKSNKLYYVLPFASVVDTHVLEKCYGKSLEMYSWSLITNHIKSNVDLKSENCISLMKGLTLLATDRLGERNNFFKFRIDKLISSQFRERHTYYSNIMTEDENKLCFQMKFKYVWNTVNPLFSSINGTPEFREVAAYFNSEVKSKEVKKIEEMIRAEGLSKALNELEKLKLSKQINNYHLIPFVRHFILKSDIWRLHSLIKDIESDTDLKIKFEALSEYAHYFLQSNIEKDKCSQTSLETVLIYLHQETKLNQAIWNKKSLQKLEDNGIYVNQEGVHVSDDDLNSAALRLNKR